MLWGKIIEEYILQDHPRQCAVADCDTELVSGLISHVFSFGARSDKAGFTFFMSPTEG